MTRLENWSVRTNDNGYRAPEQTIPYLQGNVFNHPDNSRHYDGKEIITSQIMKIDKDNRTVTTYSGTNYILGKPSVKWLGWLKDNDLPHDEDIMPFFRNLS